MRSVTVILLLIVPAIGQSQASKPAFEAASIRENIANDRPIWPPERSGARTIIHNVTLVLIVHYAWHIGNQFQVSFPAGMPSEKYDIETVSDGTPDEDQLRVMFQSLLEDRFKLKTHYEQREVDQWDLVVSKPGKLKPADPKSTVTASGISMPPGITAILTESDGRHLVCNACSIVQIADGFSRILGAPVANKINLDGAYSYDIPLDEYPPNIPSIVGELGLNLAKSKVSLRILVIDHFEKPTPN
jgi:uncharacterized protein (TIGR03435 family)